MAHTYRLLNAEDKSTIKPFGEIVEIGNAQVVAYELSLSSEHRPSSTIMIVENITDHVECFYHNGDRYERV
ncbi:hypothetical protein [Rhizobium phage RHEph16]|uniref:Uncharacterized protein n=1 Tax=Rhizobium phage RHEph16 TaxID=2836132 RepID=A0AAE8AVZ3_9CAUD|nr:hypothetical protein PP750_gp07 [Rhizobium phage RHEph16]QXV74316.1 hypothetical protein [Rhizobium phage RHEph16]